MVCVVAAAWSDLRRRRIPNAVVLPGLAAAMFSSFHEYGWSVGLLPSIYGAGVALLLTLPMYALRALGAGDVKLMMLVGAGAGTTGLLQVAAIAIVLAALIGLAMSAVTGKLRLFGANLQIGALAMIARDFKAASSVSEQTAYRVPFALAVALAAAIWLFYLW